MTSTSENAINIILAAVDAGQTKVVLAITKQELNLFAAQSQLGNIKRLGAIIEKVETKATAIDEVVVATFTVDMVNPF